MNVYQTHLEKSIFDLLTMDISAMGYEIVRIRLKGGNKHKNLQIMIDKADGSQINVDDCEAVSRQSSVLLDVEDLVESAYSLEVSSPGLNRPLTREIDLLSNIGKLIKLQTKLPINGQRNFTGTIESYSDSVLVLACEVNKTEINKDNILEAKLQYEIVNNNKKRRSK